MDIWTNSQTNKKIWMESNNYIKDKQYKDPVEIFFWHMQMTHSVIMWIQMNHVWEIQEAAEEQVNVLFFLPLPPFLLIQMLLPPIINHTCVLPLSHASSRVFAWFQHAEIFRTITSTQHHFHDLSANVTWQTHQTVSCWQRTKFIYTAYKYTLALVYFQATARQLKAAHFHK